MASISVESPYSQAPLDLTGSTFRLVELQPCGPTDLIKCRLTTHPLPPDCPPFVALSYMWDHTSPKDTIELNGMPFSVGHSLWTFLDEMRSRGRFRTYWIDAICIDQSNIYERNHQVQLMKDIYSEAESVSIWLGPVEEGSLCIEAMEFLRDLETWPNGKAFTTLSYGDLGVEHQTIIDLCQNKYWERMWIFQEVVLARVATICFGPWTIRFDAFHSIILNTHPRFRDNEVGLSFVGDLIMFIELRRGQAVHLYLAIRYCRTRKVTDIRDRIYGLFGISETRVSTIGVDYQIEPMDLWKKVLAYICQKELASHSTYPPPPALVGEQLAEALELDISAETIREFIETHYALYGKPSWMASRP